MNSATFPRQLTALGLEVPAPIVRAAELSRVIFDASQPTIDIEALVLDESLTPQEIADRLKEAGVERMIADYQATIRHDVSRSISRAMNRAIRASAPALLEALRGPFDEAVALLKLSIEKLGPNPPEAAIMLAGPEAMANWQARRQATQRLQAVRGARMALGEAGWGPKQQSPAWFIAEAATLEALEQAQLAFQGGLVGLAEAGFELRLNDLAEIEALTAGAKAATDAAILAKQEAKRVLDTAAAERYIRGWQKLATPKPVEETWAEATADSARAKIVKGARTPRKQETPHA